MSYRTQTICVIIISLAASVLGMIASVMLGLLLIAVSPWLLPVSIFFIAGCPIAGIVTALWTSFWAERFLDRFD